MTLAWQDRALCAGQPDGPWIARDDETAMGRRIRERQAAEICARCPVAGHCADWSEETGDIRWGNVYAGRVVTSRGGRVKQILGNWRWVA